MIQRILAVLKARNIEFLRDRTTLAWSVAMPFLLVFGLAFIFSGNDRDQFTVAVVGEDQTFDEELHPFFATRFVNFIAAQDTDDALRKVGQHQLDMLFEPAPVARYWVNPDSPAGYIAERLLLQTDAAAQKQTVTGSAIRYVDWVVPGVLGMNMMFACLFGVGYVVVRYRKNGFLKRLRATPLSALEFISAQVISRLILTVGVTAGVFLGVKLLLGIAMEGSYWALLLVATVGSSALISLALVLAARVSSEEFAGGILNIVSWPMMLLSGVFFSLEGSASWLRAVADVLPLTQMLTAARAIMIDGAGLIDVWPQLVILSAMTVVFLTLGSVLFRWRFT